MAITIDEGGWFANDPSIRKWSCPMIEHGVMKLIRGIIVHQTGGATASSTLNGYKKAGANGAHFLIDKDGATYQVASMQRKTWHVGKLKSKCLELHTCSPTEAKALKGKNFKEIDKIEMVKTVPARFPSNEDSIGIELVGACSLDSKYMKGLSPNLTASQRKNEIDDLMAEHGVFETVTPLQNVALRQLIEKIQTGLVMPAEDREQIFLHPKVSYKNPTEASTAQWKAGK